MALIHKMGLKTIIVSISENCHEDQMNSHGKEACGSKVADLPVWSDSTQLPL